ncbi:MAG: polysulfide reductase NrfD [Proteobacteria bacterium]|nr:polysulfide reductase NrfD [Pseudomonadota bacterium]MCL2307241.1 polysulfide reductase NrfD [Pseudomonadota bacterium]
MKMDLSIKNLISFEKTPANVTMAVLATALLALFLGGVVSYLIQGHEAYHVTREHPWGLLLTGYVFWAVACTGLCLVSSLGHVFGLKEFETIGKRATACAIIFVVTAFLVIALELGHPFRIAIYNVISPGFSSAIWWMGTLYSLYLMILVVEFFFLSSEKHHHRVKSVSIIALIVGVAANSTLASVFALLVARPYINSAFFPVSFILVTMIAGCFLVFLIYGLKHKLQFPPEMKTMLLKLSKILGVLLLALAFFEFWRVLTGIFGNMPERAETILYSIGQPSYWVAEIGLGILIPLMVIAAGKAQAFKAMVWASLGGIIGVFFMRYNSIHGVFAYPMDTMLRSEYEAVKTWVQYSPSVTEIAIVLGSVGVVLVLYHVVDKWLGLESKHH